MFLNIPLFCRALTPKNVLRMRTSANALTLDEYFVFTAPFVRYAINGAQIPKQILMPVILWLADKWLRVLEEQDDTTVVENADL